MRAQFAALLIAAPALLPAAAHAQDLTLYGGATVTSDYVFRSVTFSDNQPTLQPYVELSYGGFYAGVWASNVDFGPAPPTTSSSTTTSATAARRRAG